MSFADSLLAAASQTACLGVLRIGRYVRTVVHPCPGPKQAHEYQVASGYYDSLVPIRQRSRWGNIAIPKQQSTPLSFSHWIRCRRH
jgi:hypothetical protein